MGRVARRRRSTAAYSELSVKATVCQKPKKRKTSLRETEAASDEQLQMHSIRSLLTCQTQSTHSCFSSSLASACSPHDTTYSLCTAMNGPKYVDTSAICRVLMCCSCQHLRAVGQFEIVLYLHNNQITLNLLTTSCVHKHMAHVEDHKLFFFPNNRSRSVNCL